MAPEGRNLSWHDEFDGNSIDPANWTFDNGGGGWGNGEGEYYTSRPENVRLENGMQVIEARVGDREWVFNPPFFIILNLAVGDQLPGMVGLDSVFPAQLYVDYVRVYQR